PARCAKVFSAAGFVGLLRAVSTQRDLFGIEDEGAASPSGTSLGFQRDSLLWWASLQWKLIGAPGGEA
ncbi:MAG: hypothetical protein ACOYMN_18170, partial [Roseimicrobium sp.]